MKTVHVDLKKRNGIIKPMHSVNNGPPTVGSEYMNDFREAGIPYIRNHDASIASGAGNEHIVDVENIFRDMTKDENDPKNYDFFLTDLYCEANLKAGSRIFYRLGSRIEHWAKKYHTLKPADFEKYARVCEHIIRHLCYGWADGHEYDIPYFEIWNEADNVHPDGSSPCWSGNEAEFLEFYKVMSRHLKKCFPDKKIGGPAYTHFFGSDWCVHFVEYCAANQLPLDFFSWHGYEKEASRYGEAAFRVKELLLQYGYKDAELILNEWNYVYEWRGPGRNISIDTRFSEKGGAFCAAAILGAQKSPMDIFMYYDLRASQQYNGLFTAYTYRRTPAYYAFWQFNQLYCLKNELFSEAEQPLYVGAAGNETEAAVQIAYYQEELPAEEDVLEIDLKGAKKGAEVSVYLTDKNGLNVFVRRDILSGDETCLYLPLKPYDVYFLTVK